MIGSRKNTMATYLIKVLSFAAVLFVFNNSSLSWACEKGFTRFEDWCYRLGHDAESWGTAMYTCICRLEYGNLAHINSARENRFLQQLLRNHSVIQAWIAATDIDTQNDWLWWPDKTRLSYSNWDAGEPNNLKGEENCGLLQNNGFWNDGNCFMHNVYICELPYEAPPVIG